MPSIKALRQAPEAERLAFVRAIVDDLARRLTDDLADEAQAVAWVAAVRFQARLLIPEQMDTYDLIYGSRFRRLIEQFVRPAARPDPVDASSPLEALR
jgi:hypothetical protein